MAATPSSHLVLARKWRPERFGELVGQEHVTRTLAQALKSGRIAHAFLFTGIRGVGKTTAARIMARCLNCEHGPTPEPCGTCPACVEIRSGSALDVVEIDGATYRKIDDARAIIENLSYRPARDRFKIYIIDEAHQLTDQAFNALLKTLEEPPAHIKFILATTEAQKMPETILSRLQRYDFRRIPFAVIFERLRELASREGIGADEAALRMLAREAGGSMRDAERMLETAIASLDGKVVESEVAAILGVASRSRVFGIVEAILGHDAGSALATVRELHRSGANFESLGRDILELLRNLAVAKLPDASGPQSPLADLPDQEASELKRLAATASNRDLMRLFRLMADAQEQLIRSPYPDLLLEMAVIRMAAIAPVIDADELLHAIGAGAGVGPAKSTVGGGNPPGSAPHSSPGTSLTSPQGGPLKASAIPTLTEASLAPGPSRRIKVEGEVKAKAPTRSNDASSAFQTAPAGPAGTAPANASANLSELRDFIRGRRAALFGFMEQGAMLELNGDVLTIVPRNDIYIRYLSDNRATIAELASELYGRRIRAEIVEVGAPQPSSSNVTTAANGVDAAAAAPRSTIRTTDHDAAVPAALTDNINGARSTGTAIDGDAAPVGPQTATAPSDADAPSASGGGGVSGKSQAELKQSVYGDPVVKRIFDEFQARLVEVREQPVGSFAAGDLVRKP